MRTTPSLALLPLALLATPAALPAQGRADAPRPILEDQHRLVPGHARGGVLAPGDLDGDGDLDFVIGSSQEPAILRNEGDSRFVRVDGTFRGTGGSPSAAAAVGFLNEDDRVDVFLGDSPYFSDGRGGFEIGPSPFPPFFSVSNVVLADVEGDGDLDVLLEAGMQIHLALNDGTGAFVDASGQVPDVDGLGISFSDLDHDGDPDIVRGTKSILLTGKVTQPTVLLNDGGGNFTEDPTAVPPFSKPFQYARTIVADFDGDGFDDLFIAPGYLPPRGSPRPVFLRNDGTAHFVDATAGLPPGGSYAAAAADVDGDHDLDVAFAFPPLLFLNDGTGRFVADNTRLPPEPEGQSNVLVAADVDLDRDVDLMTIAGGAYRLLLNDGEARYLDVQRHVQPAFSSPIALELADLDGDGDLDALGSQGTELDLWLGDGAGAMTEAPGRIPALSLGYAQDLPLGDVDGDGDVDALVLDAPARLLVNDGSAVFTEEPGRLPVELGATQSALLVDLDGDGDLDAFVGKGSLGSPPLPDAVWRNDGHGVFAADPGVLPPLSRTTLSLAAADVDHDGDLDVLAGNAGQNTLYRNDGDGGFADATADLPVEATSNWTTDVELGDLDRDGDLDAYYANIGSDDPPCTGGCADIILYAVPNQVLLNDGHGRFTDEPTWNSEPNASGCAELGDFDGDGDLDVIVGNIDTVLASSEGNSELFLNDGAGFLAPALPSGTEALPGDETEYAYAAGDLDGDGDDDVFSGRRVWTNVTRSLAWRTLARLGRPLELVLWGEPGGRYVLVAAGHQASIPLGSPGTLAIDPRSILFTTVGTLDDRGGALRRFRIPEAPALVGHTIHWQALVGPHPRLTNREPTTIYAH